MGGPQGAEAIIPVPLQGQLSSVYIPHHIFYKTYILALIKN